MMDKPPSDPQFIQTFTHYWAALSAEGQGMAMAFLIAGLKVIYGDKKHNWRRDIAETLLMPLIFFGAYKGGVWLFGFDERAAVPFPVRCLSSCILYTLLPPLITCIPPSLPLTASTPHRFCRA